MKAIVVEHLTPEEKQQFASILERKESVQVVRNEKPRKFIHNWQMEDLVPILDQSTHGRSFAGGRAALEAAQCLRCHRFKTEGNSVAHDLTGAGNRFSPRDLLESIILPSKVISDQYASKTVVTNDGLAVTGLAQAQEDGSLIVYQSNGQEVKIAKQDIEQIEVSPISTMPEGLLSILTKDEVLDLIAYLRSAGDPKDKAFGGAK
jgi:putative heme-binding domain-containing protein